VGANERISMRVSPEVSFAPANLSVRTTVEAHPDNRWIEIIAESDDFYRSSEMQLDGEHAPRTTIFEFRSLPGGTYQVHAFLKGTHGRQIASSHKQIDVVGESGGLR